MCVECGCNTPVPFGIKVIRALAPGLLRANTVAAVQAGTTAAKEVPGGHEASGPASVSGGAPASEGVRIVAVRIPLLAKNDRIAERNREFFHGRGMLALNLVSSPGSGKTTLLGRTLDEFGLQTKCAVVVGDLETDNDARRLARPHVPVAQITTGTACHLDAEMVAKSVASLDLEGVRVMFIENVGNLVCPAEFDLGEELRVVLLATTEGEDKPLKYPPIFKSAHVVLLTKIDVAEALGFSREVAAENIRRIAPQAKLIQLSARSGEGMEEWYALLRARLPQIARP